MTAKPSLSRLPRPLLPAAVLLVVVLILLVRGAPGDDASGLASPYAFHAILVATATLSLPFNRSRVFFTACVLGLAQWGLETYPWAADGEGVGSIVHASICALVPLNFLIFSILEERGFLTPVGGLRVLFIAAQVVLVHWFARPGNPDAAVIYTELMSLSWLSFTPISQLGLAIGAVAFGALLVRLSFTGSPLDAGSLGAMVLSAGALHVAGQPWATGLLMNAAALSLVMALIEDSYGKAYVDELTEIPGRRALEERLLQVRSRFAIAMVDVDHFKKVNDRHGHDVGDQVLRKVAAMVRSVGGGGRAFRYGGEEFAIVFGDKTPDEALPHLENLREAMAAQPFTVRGPNRPKAKPESKPKGGGERKLRVTVSIGLAGRTDECPTPRAVIDAADKALYRAKKKGRNRVVA